MTHDGCPRASLLEQYLDQPLNDDASDEIQIHVATVPSVPQAPR